MYRVSKRVNKRKKMYDEILVWCGLVKFQMVCFRFNIPKCSAYIAFCYKHKTNTHKYEYNI